MGLPYLACLQVGISLSSFVDVTGIGARELRSPLTLQFASFWISLSDMYMYSNENLASGFAHDLAGKSSGQKFRAERGKKSEARDRSTL